MTVVVRCDKCGEVAHYAMTVVKMAATELNEKAQQAGVADLCEKHYREIYQWMRQP